MIWYNSIALDFITLFNYLIMVLVILYSVVIVRVLLSLLARSYKQMIPRYSLVAYWGSVYLTIALIISLLYGVPSIHYLTILYLPLAINGFVMTEIAFRKIPQFKELHFFKRNFLFVTFSLLYAAYVFSIFFYLGWYMNIVLLMASIVSLLFSYLILAYVSLITKSKTKFIKNLVYFIFYLFYLDAFLVLLSLVCTDGEFIILTIHSVIYYMIIVLLLLISIMHRINVKLM